jgi:hypothetical protein
MKGGCAWLKVLHVLLFPAGSLSGQKLLAWEVLAERKGSSFDHDGCRHDVFVNLLCVRAPLAHELRKL